MRLGRDQCKNYNYNRKGDKSWRMEAETDYEQIY